MADENTVTDPAVVAAKNEETIRKQAAQDISGGIKIGDSLDAVASLDSIREQIVKDKKEASGDEPDIVQPKPDDAPAPTTSTTATTATAATPPTTPTPTTPTPTTPTVTPKPGETAPTAEDEERARLKKTEDEIFKGAPTLPPNASPKSSEAFASVKLRAAQEISKLSQEIETLKTKNTELERKASAPLPENVEKELKELREFRQRLDIDADPKFREFDKNVSQAQEFIYAQLKKSPTITDDIIAEIKKYGGPEKVKMEKILDTVNDPMIRRLVESKLADIEMTNFQKEQAIKKAKEDIGAYVAEREKQYSEIGQSHNKATVQNLEKLAAQLPWMKPMTVDPKADEPTRKQAEAHNTYLEKTRKEIEIAVQDDSPEMRATLIVGMVQLFRLQQTHEATVAQLKTAEESLKKAEDTISRLKNASKSRLQESEAINGGESKPKPANILEPAGDALDRLRREKAKAAA